MRTVLELRRVYSGPSISNPLNGGSSDQPHCYCYHTNLWLPMVTVETYGAPILNLALHVVATLWCYGTNLFSYS